MIKNLILFALLYSSSTAAAQIRVAVLDTGIRNAENLPLCGESKDLTGEGLVDLHGHGTNVSYLIKRYAGNADYCIIPIKYYSTEAPGFLNLKRTKQALRLALKYKVDVIVYAGGGPSINLEEKQLITEALDKNIKIVVAAGNNRHNLDKSCNYFPACYDSRIIVAGCAHNGRICSFGNYGKVVDFYEDGLRVTAGGITFSGTSQATAIRAGKLINQLSRGLNGNHKSDHAYGIDPHDLRRENRRRTTPSCH